MAIEEITNVSWFGRIGNAFKGILFGIVLVVGGPLLLIFNERNAVRDIEANKEIAEKVTSIANDSVSPANDGQLVHLNGATETEDVVQNDQFGISEQAIRLTWKAEIFQWVEEEETETNKKLGGGEEIITTYTYHKRWVGAPVDSSGFKEAGHDNPKGRKFQSGSSQAKNVSLGAFTLPGGLISKITSAQQYPLQTLPEKLQAKGSLVNGGFFTGSDAASPKIGDERVSFKLTRPGDVSVMAVQTGSTFKKYQAKNGKEKFLLSEGLLSAVEMVKEEERKAAVLRWVLRGVGVLLLTIGFGLILKPLSVFADVIPLFGSLVGGVTGLISLLLALGIGFVVIAISWVTFRPLIGIPLLILGVGCFVLLIMKLVKEKKKVEAPPPLRVS